MSFENTENILKRKERYSHNCMAEMLYFIFFSSMCPYLFFSNNGTSISQVGFELELKSKFLMNTYTKEIIMNHLSPEMFKFLAEYVKIPFHNAP